MFIDIDRITRTDSLDLEEDSENEQDDSIVENKDEDQDGFQINQDIIEENQSAYFSHCNTFEPYETPGTNVTHVKIQTYQVWRIGCLN